MTPDEATRLKRVVDEALKEARKRPDDERVRMGAINWGDLWCIDVEERKSLLTDTVFIAVVIEEASPDAQGLQQFVGDWLDQRGYKQVYVSTEW